MTLPPSATLHHGHGRWLDGRGRAPLAAVLTLVVLLWSASATWATGGADDELRGPTDVAGLSAVDAADLAETGQVVITHRSGTYRTVSIRDLDHLDAVVAEVHRDPSLVGVEVDRPVSATGDPLADGQWEHTRIGIDLAHELVTGDEVVVAVLDTGVDAAHEDLTGQVLEGYDVLTGTAGATTDTHGHGTAVAGIVAAIAGNGLGLAGAAPDVRILPVRVLDDDGSGTMSGVAAGIDWATGQGADVINLSLAGAGDSPTVHTSIRAAAEAGVVLVASAGNEGDDTPMYPAAYAETVAVSATNKDDGLASFSSTGDHIDLAAPGVHLTTTLPDDGYSGRFSGTSASAPVVSATLALAFEAAGDHDRGPEHAQAVLDAVTSTALDLGEEGIDAEFGHGLVQANDAVLAASLLALEDEEDETDGDGGESTDETEDDTTEDDTTEDDTTEDDTTEDDTTEDDTGDTDGDSEDEAGDDTEDSTEDDSKDETGPAKEACPEAVPSGGFTDTVGSVHEHFVDCMAWWGITAGVEPGIFAPKQDVTRAQIATFLHRTLDHTGLLPGDAPRASFGDVAAGHTHVIGIETLAGLGVIHGTDATRFSPGRDATRAQMASLIVRMHEEIVGREITPSSTTFSDVAGSTHETNIAKLVALGVTTGYDDGTFRPGEAVTRGQMATFVMRYVEHLADQGLTTAPELGLP